MALSLEQTKHLIRLQTTAEELLGSVRAWKGGNVSPLRAASDQIDALISSVRDVLLASEDRQLADQFEREVAGESSGFHGADARASALVGWLKGVTQAESFEAQMAANAKAYAEAKVRAERGVGFQPPDAT